MCLCVHVSNHNYDMTHRKHPRITGVSAQLAIPIEPTTPDNGTGTRPDDAGKRYRIEFFLPCTPVTPPVSLTFSAVTGGVNFITPEGCGCDRGNFGLLHNIELMNWMI